MSKIQDYEIKYMLSKHPLEYNRKQMEIHYGKEKVEEMEKLFSSHKEFLPCLGNPGVATRFKQFYDYIKDSKHQSAYDAFVGFAEFLGRVKSYRALALTKKQFEDIEKKNEIFPSGILRTTEKELDKLINDVGVFKICYARLYIGLQLVKYDPSVSLHDDPETAVCIGSGYIEDDKRVYLMCMNVPKIEALGYKVCDLHDPSNTNRWFKFRGIWFDSFLERTERYVLHGIPFFKERLDNLKILEEKDIPEFLEEFKKDQLKKKIESRVE